MLDLLYNQKKFEVGKSEEFCDMKTGPEQFKSLKSASISFNWCTNSDFFLSSDSLK